ELRQVLRAENPAVALVTLPVDELARAGRIRNALKSVTLRETFSLVQALFPVQEIRLQNRRAHLGEGLGWAFLRRFQNLHFEVPVFRFRAPHVRQELPFGKLPEIPWKLKSVQ